MSRFNLFGQWLFLNSVKRSWNRNLNEERLKLTDHLECLFEWHRASSRQLEQFNFWIIVIIYIHCIGYRFHCVVNMFVLRINVAFVGVEMPITSVNLSNLLTIGRSMCFQLLFKQITKRIQICSTSNCLFRPHTQHWNHVNMSKRMV